MDDLDIAWEETRAAVAGILGRKPGVEGLLFLIGLHADGRGFEPELSKDEKQRLIIAGGNRALSEAGVSPDTGSHFGVPNEDTDGRPRDETASGGPDSEDVLKEGIVRYIRRAMHDIG